MDLFKPVLLINLWLYKSLGRVFYWAKILATHTPMRLTLGTSFNDKIRFGFMCFPHFQFGQETQYQVFILVDNQGKILIVFFDVSLEKSFEHAAQSFGIKQVFGAEKSCQHFILVELIKFFLFDPVTFHGTFQCFQKWTDLPCFRVCERMSCK